MLNLSPSSYRNVNDGDRPVNTKKIYSRRPWYAPPIDPAEVLLNTEDAQSNYENEFQSSQEEEYYDRDTDYVEPVIPRNPPPQQVLGQLVEPTPNPRFEQNPTDTTVTEFSFGNAVNLREVALVALGGASAALVLLIVMAGVFVARRRKKSPSPAPSPPILVYPPHDVTAPCYMTKEVNFSLPSFRSSSLGELRDVVSVSSLGSEILCPPVPTQHRSNSFRDSGYPLRKSMMTPILNTVEGTPQHYYYGLHVTARNCIERCIGVLKARFRCLLVARALHYKPMVAAKIVNACCVLHNIANETDAAVPQLSAEEEGAENLLQQETAAEANRILEVDEARNRRVNRDLLAGRSLQQALVDRLWREKNMSNTADLGVLDPSLYKPDCLDEDLLWPEGHVGRVWFTMKYESGTERLQVHIIKAKHLPSRTPALANACDPYIKIQLMPDERRVLQTKQKKKTCNPFFDETFVYQIPPGKLESLTLKLSVLDIGKVGKGKQLIGHIILPLSELEGVASDEEPQLYKLDIEKELQEPTSDLGEILISLLYNENLHRLTVTVIEARALKMDPSSTKRELIVRVTQERACRGVRTRRTAAVDVAEDGSALVSECFHFRLRADELHTTSVTVQALQPHSAYGKDRVLGKFVLGSYMFTRGRALQHWNSTLASPMEQVKQWHSLNH